jgi:hypothetical protein
MYNSFVTAMTPSWMVTDFKHWLEIMSDEEYARWLNEPEQKKLWPSECENGRQPPTPIKEDQRMLDPGQAAPLAYDPSYCELPPDLMFAHDAVFPEDEPVADVDLSFPEYRENWWDEVEADRNILSRGSMKNRVDDYLKNSKKISCLC